MSLWSDIRKEVDRIETAIHFLQVKLDEAEAEAKEAEESIEAKDSTISELQSEIEYMRKHGGST